MYDPSDKNYIISKDIKQHYKTIDPQYAALSKWINDQFSVLVLNVYLEYIQIELQQIPRLTIVLENTKDYNTFFSSPFLHNTKITNRILFYSQEYLYNLNKQNIDKLFIVFNDFQKDYSSELSIKISKSNLWSIIPVDYWTSTWDISSINMEVTLFFLTEKQKKEFTSQTVYDTMKNAYLNLIKNIDQFDYIDFDKIEVHFDSKENFDKNYNSNWYYYYK